MDPVVVNGRGIAGLVSPGERYSFLCFGRGCDAVTLFRLPRLCSPSALIWGALLGVDCAQLAAGNPSHLSTVLSR